MYRENIDECYVGKLREANDEGLKGVENREELQIINLKKNYIYNYS